MILSVKLSGFSPKWIAAVFGVVGVVLLGVSVNGARQRVEKLRSWSLVEARVDGGDVVSILSRERRVAMYAARLRLRYDFGGKQYIVPATEEVYSSSYASQARGVQETTRKGNVQVLLDPGQPDAPVLNAGYNPEFFFWSLITGLIGVVFVSLATLVWRAFRVRPPGATKVQGSASVVWLIVFFAVFGVSFIGGGGTAFYFAQREISTWRPVDARVDSTDVVWRSSRSGSTSIDVYAPRAWTTYDFRESVYHVPIVRGAYWNDSSSAAAAAMEIQRTGTIGVRFDPNNPFDASLGRPGAVRRFWMPALFILPGIVCLILVWVFGRKRRRRRPRRSRRKAAVAV